MPSGTDIVIPENEVEISAVRAQGAGGQNVNKVSNAIHLRFDVRASSLPDAVKERLLKVSDQRITRTGIVVIKAQQHRSQDMNRAEALARLHELVRSAAFVPKKRRPSGWAQVESSSRSLHCWDCMPSCSPSRPPTLRSRSPAVFTSCTSA